MAVKKAQTVLELIGATPLLKLNRLVPEGSADVYLKLEYFNAGGSIKDRIAYNMIAKAEEEGLIKPGDTLIEATSGNTGIGLAMVAAVKGYRLIIVMSKNASRERKQLMEAYGAELVLVEGGSDGKKADILKMEELVARHGYFPLRQCDNPHNPEIHVVTTGPEIVEALGGSAPDGFVAGIGTGGTITGTGAFLRSRNPSIYIAAVEPAGSPILSGGKPGPHAIQGIGAGFVPGVLNTAIYNEVIPIQDDDAVNTMRALARQEGVIVGYSSGAAAFAALQVAKRLGKGKTVVAIAPDTGERYLSTPAFQNT
ncbi:MAG: cysteine synthase A [Oscillospiraceae bacterium]